MQTRKFITITVVGEKGERYSNSYNTLKDFYRDQIVKQYPMLNTFKNLLILDDKYTQKHHTKTFMKYYKQLNYREINHKITYEPFMEFSKDNSLWWTPTITVTEEKRKNN